METGKTNQISLSKDSAQRLAMVYQYILSDQWGKAEKTTLDAGDKRVEQGDNSKDVSNGGYDSEAAPAGGEH